MAELAARHGDQPGAHLGRRDAELSRTSPARANRYARWALAQDLRKGEVVCLMMPNRPEYLAIWLGIVAAGGARALINTNLAGAALAQCHEHVEPKHLGVADALAPRLADAIPLLNGKPQVWVHGAKRPDAAPRIDSVIETLSGDPLTATERPALTIEDRALFIYTSGTTGLPKAANINHYRVMLAALGFAGVVGARAADRMYDCLPMYHTTGGLAAIGALLVQGGSVVIRDKFSASGFWDDIARHDCTIFQYVGELCRYLLNAPPHDGEPRHRLRLACGNGLRPDIWDAFQKRFRIPRIVEFYAATEGNVTMFNVEGKPGAIRPPAAAAGATLSGPASCASTWHGKRPIRDARGFCIRCAPGETGEAIGAHRQRPRGYRRAASKAMPTAPTASARSCAIVFEPGDAWFRTGDLMRQDGRDYFYFVDRIGDTFRWKGENVSTAEVTEALTAFAGIRDANVYGVDVAGHEGRAGMAAIMADGALDLAGLRACASACTAAILCAPAVRAHRRSARRDDDIQAQEDRLGGARLRSG